MKRLGRILGWLLFVPALLALGVDVLYSLEAGSWTPYALGEAWYAIHVPSLNLSQAVVQRYLHPTIWDPVIVTVLLWPASAVFGLPALLLTIFCRPPPGQRRLFT